MSDSQEISNLLTDQEFNEAISSYTDSQLEYINDMNNGNYTSNQVNFDTLSIRDKWWTPQDSFIQIPLSFTGSANDSATPTVANVAFKRSALDLINSVQVMSSSGQTLVNEQLCPLINYLRLVVEKDTNWYVSEAPKIQFQKDTVATSQTDVGPVAPTTATAAGATFNAGLLSRIGLFKQQSTSFTASAAGPPIVGGVYTATLQIPLQYIHDFFAQMNFPIVNCRWQLSFGLNQGSTSVLQPLATTSTAAVAIYSAQVSGTCRLYYKSVKFNPTLAQKLVAKINSGLTKTVSFRLTDTYVGEVNQGNGTSLNRLITPSTIHPLRVWVVSPPNGTASTFGNITPSVAQFSAANVLVNNSLYYNNGLNTPQEQFAVLADQFPGRQNSSSDGSLISYSDFLNGYRFLCFDLSRLKERLRNPNEACSIQANLTRGAGGNCDYYYLIEKLQKIVINMSSSETKYVVGL